LLSFIARNIFFFLFTTLVLGKNVTIYGYVRLCMGTVYDSVFISVLTPSLLLLFFFHVHDGGSSILFDCVSVYFLPGSSFAGGSIEFRLKYSNNINSYACNTNVARRPFHTFLWFYFFCQTHRQDALKTDCVSVTGI